MPTKVDTYQSSQFINRHRETVRGGAGSGCGGHFKDGFTASPQPDTAPPSKQKSQSRLLLRLWLWLLLRRLPLRVPGRRPGR